VTTRGAVDIGPVQVTPESPTWCAAVDPDWVVVDPVAGFRGAWPGRPAGAMCYRMTPDDLSGLVRGEFGGGTGPDEQATVCPLVDDGNLRVLQAWLADHDTYDAVEADGHPLDAAFDLCIVDEAELREHRERLESLRDEASPVLVPVLLLLSESGADVIETDQGAIADSVFSTTVDEIVSLPIRQMELEWRIRSLLRLRDQSITAHRRTEELRLFQQAVESAGYAIYITDTDGTIRYVNPAFEESTGYTSAEAVGRTPELFHSGEMPDGYFADLWETVKSGEVWQGDVVDRRKDGELYTAAQTVAPVSEDGEVRAFVAVQDDITERKDREERLQQRTHTVDEAPVGITITDPDRADNPMIYVNDAFVEMTGYSRADILGRNCRVLQGENTDPDRVASIREAIDAGEPVSVELRNYREDGTEFWNHLEVAPVRDDDGTITNWVGFQQDVTERKRRRKQLEVLDRTLRHNLRNELNVIRGRAETIRARASGETLTSAEQIIETSDRLVAMAEKEQAVTELLRDEPEQVEAELRSLCLDIASAARAEHDSVTVDVDCPDGVVASVSTAFDRALRELVTNAVVHNDASTPEVTLSVTERDETVRVEVADNGPKIPEMERKILLEESHQTPLYHGSGLGLWLVKLVVTRSGGTVSFAERGSRGNVFRIELVG
jgi:PAS domain S-box-containing protein